MAVPPTHDGSVGPSSTSGSTLLNAVTAVLAVVCVACVVVLGVRYADTSGSVGDRVGQVFGGDDAEAEAAGDDTRTRELVLSQANQFVIRINTYGPSDLDKDNKLPGYVDRVKEVITPKLDVEFEKSVTFAEQSVAQAGLERSVQLYASGAESLGSDVATVLVTGVITQSYPDPTTEGRIEYEPELFRYEVSMVKTGGTWLADNFEPVRGEVEGEPTEGAPTEEPQEPSTVDPSAGTNASAVARYGRLVSGRADAVQSATTALDGCGLPGVVSSASAACAAAPRTLSSAARTLAVALRDAARPDARGYVGAPPEAIAGLVTVTRQAAGAVVTAAGDLRPACVVTDSPACAAQREALTQAAADLLTALDSWGAVG